MKDAHTCLKFEKHGCSVIQKPIVQKYIILFLCLILFIFAAGCGRTTSSENEADGIIEKSAVDTTYKVYYLSEDGMSLSYVSVIFTAQTAEELIEQCLEHLQTVPEGEDSLIVPIGENLTVLDTVYDSVTKQVDIYFDSGYEQLDKIQEVLVRAAIVKTMTQFDGVIDYVQFFVDGEALTESDGTQLLMMQSDFVESTRTDVAGLNAETIRLYFASTDGTKLVAEDVYVHYSDSYSIERVVVESLIAGPISETLNATMSSDVKLYDDITVIDGVCYVDFNQRFLDRVNDQSFALNVYSVVNSLTELEGIDQVQIKIDGEIVAGSDETVSLDQPLSRNEDLILTSTDTVVVVETETESEETKKQTQTESGEEETEQSGTQTDQSGGEVEQSETQTDQSGGEAEQSETQTDQSGGEAEQSET